jgi:hypothetical protein
MITQPAVLPCAILIAAILAAHWLGNKKNIILDFFVALAVLILIIAVVIQVSHILR